MMRSAEQDELQDRYGYRYFDCRGYRIGIAKPLIEAAVGEHTDIVLEAQPFDEVALLVGQCEGVNNGATIILSVFHFIRNIRLFF